MTNERSPETRGMLETRSDGGGGTEEMVGRRGGVRVLFGEEEEEREEKEKKEKKVKKK